MYSSGTRRRNMADGEIWTRLSDVFDALKADIPGSLINGFEDFDELMRLDLERLRPYAVDYETIPFGRDNPNASGIYRPPRWRPVFSRRQTLAVRNAGPAHISDDRDTGGERHRKGHRRGLCGSHQAQ